MEEAPHNEGTATASEVMDQFAWHEPPVADGAARTALVQRQRRPHAVATLRNFPGLPKPSYQRESSSSASAAGPAGSCMKPHNAVFDAFKRKRLFEKAKQGQELPKNMAWKEWSALPEEDRNSFKCELQELQRADDATALAEACSAERKSAAAVVLQKLREQASRKPTAAEIREKLTQSAPGPSSQKRKRKDAVKENVPIPAPVFKQRSGALGCAERADRRREMAGAVRSRTEGSKADITIASSHHVSLTEVSARLSAPQLSCDWNRHTGSDSDAEDSRLEVDMPADSDSRKWMEEDLQRRISAAKVRRLVQVGES